MAATKKRGDTRPKASVFLVDDFDMTEAAVRTIVSEAPEHDLAFAGSDKTFGPDVYEIIRLSAADVLLIDIEDKSHDPVGLRTIREVRQRRGSAIGIIAYTMHLKYLEAALDYGADRFLKKGVTNDDLRQAIRTCKDHDTISKLELFLEEREVQVTVTRFGSNERGVRLNLGRHAFALVYYLAEERARGQTGWIIKEDRDEKSLPYTFREMEFWSALRRRWIDRSDPEDNDKSDGMNIPTRYSFQINRAIKDSLENENLPLVIVPGGGRKSLHSYTSTYFLNPFIESTQIRFRGTRVPLPGKKGH